MEKQSKSKNKFLKLLPRAATAVNFQNPPFSPGRDKFRCNQHGCKGFSGPIIKMIPDEVRTKPKNGGEFETQEPTSPKVSCIGQIKHKKKMNKAKRAEEKNRGASRPDELKKQTSRIRRLFSRSTTKDRRKSDASKDEKVRVPERGPPGLGQIRRFASSRDTFANFDWTAQIAPVDLDHREYPFSDDDIRDSDREEEEEEEIIIPFSAPMAIGGGASKPRKEINLWKRRTTNPPIPLRLNSSEA
ncbi:hypothetical protein K2173_027827 [Erythroxylum novogranatense]|uniref:Syringolide-induced protein 14-1-1 n=1 Tax=Erythroxylum novogranatense TaxID=1862640 RepID=A0AAV8U3Q9_9ROSI|nr:hypothetical protein K2173_027827 [Erythroxylum novogranatense]